MEKPRLIVRAVQNQMDFVKGPGGPSRCQSAGKKGCSRNRNVLGP